MKGLRSVVSQLKKASRMHLQQAKQIERHIRQMQSIAKKNK